MVSGIVRRSTITKLAREELMIETGANDNIRAAFESGSPRKWSGPSIATLLILFLAFVAVQEFNVAPEWATISAIVAG
jgi:hypothetical protein